MLPQTTEQEVISQCDCSSQVEPQELQHRAVYTEKKKRKLTKREKQMQRQTLQQVVTARQEKIYAQQCEIDELRRKIHTVCADNKFLREQNYWQARALERLDGKHAELPQLINGHLEEIRVFREQIKRMKEVLKLEKQRRQEAEAANEKTLVELRHLRRLAEEQNLLEREQLMHTIEKLQSETEQRGKLLTNLEKYAENLEKNQRFESIRHAKTRKDLKLTCQNLLDRIQALEQTVQEKQKIIELQNIYSNRFWKPISEQKRNDMPDHLGDRAKVHLEALSLETGEKKRFSERKTFKKDKHRRKNCSSPPADAYKVNGTQNAVVTNESDALNTDNQHRDRENKHKVPLPSGQQSTKSSREAIVLPKIQRSDASEEEQKIQDEHAKSTHENRQVHFSSSEENKLQIANEITFEELRNKESEARLYAEKHLAKSDLSTNPKPGSTVNSNGDGFVKHDAGIKESNLVSTSKKRLHGNSEHPTALETLGNNKDVSTLELKSENNGDTRKMEEDSGIHTSISPNPNSPLPSRTTSGLSSCDSSTLIPLETTIDQHICRPCGDQDLDEFFIADSSACTSSDSMNDEYMIWGENSVNPTRSTAGSSQLVHHVDEGNAADDTLNKVVGDNSNETNTGPELTQLMNHPTLIKMDIPVVNCAVRTKTLYSINKANSTDTKDQSDRKVSQD